MIPINHADTGDPLASIERMIEHYRVAKKRRLHRRAIVKWRKLQAQKRLVEFDRPFERVH